MLTTRLMAAVLGTLSCVGPVSAQLPIGREIDRREDARRLQQQIQEERQRRLGGTLRDVDRAATPPRGDLEFGRDWQSRIAKRTSGPSLTAKEKAIFKALGSSITVTFKKERLEAVLDYLSDRTGLPIVLDKRAMDEAQVTYDTEVSVTLKNVTVRTVLKKVLADLGLTYVIKDEVIQVVTPLQAKDMLVVRNYPIADLVADPDPRITAIHVAMLIDLIQRTVDPQSWQVNGGPGTIGFYAPTMSLVIKQSAEFHGALMGGGR